VDILNQLKNIDLYLLDQIMKGRLNASSRILDAGCGEGRNCHFLIDQGCSVLGIDPLPEAIATLQEVYPHLSEEFIVCAIEDYKTEENFDFIICNAVLHFAESHHQFQCMMAALANLLTETGVLFIRMTSDFATSMAFVSDENGRADLPDGTNRYLMTKSELVKAMNENKLHFVEPLKTINVDDQRCMSTLVLSKEAKVALDIGWLDLSQNPMMR